MKKELDVKFFYDSGLKMAAREYNKEFRELGSFDYYDGYVRGLGIALGYDHDGIELDIQQAIEQDQKDTEDSKLHSEDPFEDIEAHNIDAVSV